MHSINLARFRHLDGVGSGGTLEPEKFTLSARPTNPTRLSEETPYFKCVYPTMDRGLPSLNLVSSRSVGRAGDTLALDYRRTSSLYFYPQ